MKASRSIGKREGKDLSGESRKNREHNKTMSMRDDMEGRRDNIKLEKAEGDNEKKNN